MIQNMPHMFDVDDVVRTGGRLPGVASAIDATKNIGASMNLGYNIAAAIGGEGFRTGGNLSKYGGSVGGALTLGGLAIPGAIMGATAGAFMDGGNIGTMAAIGAGVGLATPLAVGGAGYLAKRAFSSTIKNASEIGSLGKSVEGLGSGLYNIGKVAYDVIDNPISRGQVNALKAFSKNIVKFDEVKLNNITKEPLEGLESVKLGWAGNLMFYGGAIKQATSKAFDTYKQAHMGAIDPYVTRATPRIPSYGNNSGADGSLVFALNKNRRG